MIAVTKSELLLKLARAERAVSAHEREIASLKATVLRQNEEAVALARTAGVLRAANAHLRKKLDAALLQRDEARLAAREPELPVITVTETDEGLWQSFHSDRTGDAALWVWPTLGHAVSSARSFLLREFAPR